MPSIIRIGDLTLDTGRQQLTDGTAPIHLGPLTYRLLMALVEAAPNVASHDDLARVVWEGRPVSPETVSQRVKLLRDAIGDHADDPRYVELVRGRGYRLLPRMEEVEPADPRIRRKRSLWFAAAAIAVVAAVLLIRAYVTPEAASPPSPSLAVLPFADMSPNQDQAYLADGVAEEILNVLARTTSMRVIARTSSFSFALRNVDVPTIARTLKVTHVLEGSVRKSGDRVRITAQLVNASDGTHVWSDAYETEMGDILVLQKEIAASVASALQVKLLDPDQGVAMRPGEVDPEAFESYLRGLRAFRHPEQSYAASEQYFEKAIRSDPGFIPAYNQLGLVYVVQVVEVMAKLPDNREKLRDLVERGLAVAPDDAGLIGLSGQVALYDGDVELAERRFRQALALDPSNIPVRFVYRMMKLDQGRPRDALEINRPLLAIDPLNPHVYIHQWACHLDLWNLDAAVAAASRYQDVSMPADGRGPTLSAWAKFMLAGDFIGLIRDDEKAAAIMSETTERAYAWPLDYYYLGDVETGDAAIEFIRGHLGIADEPLPDNAGWTLILAYRHVVMGEIAAARQLAVPSLVERKPFTGMEPDIILSRLAIDELIASGEAARVVETIEAMAPVYRDYRSQPQIPAERFSPAPILVKSAYSSFPATYFPDYIRALRAVGDNAGAENMLNHIEAILRLRRDRGLFVEERYAAEAHSLRGHNDAALDALEQAERDRTIYNGWHVFLSHNEIFAAMRDHPRFVALVERTKAEVARQREQLAL